MTEPVLAWHFLAADGWTRRAPGYPEPVKVEVGQRLVETRPLVMCSVGLHACIRPLDALRYAPGPMACRVAMTGARVTDPAHLDKLCYAERTVLAMADATALLHEFACWCAEAALEAERAAGREPDPRCWAAIKAKRCWLKGEITDDQLAAARAAAEAAAWDPRAAAEAAARDAPWAAARAAARDAAWAAAWAAARDAARDTARDAAWSAEAAAEAAAWDARDAARAAAEAAAWDAARAAQDAQNTELERRLLALLGLSGESA